ncbi:hypothetical protein KP509_33G018400 [Ceratopteris richardii]|uniref:Uncharacterized protein n=1 Tax=Ceratopteris richardii TaxID=49495 RepID=A0A8T2QNN9_CERRI|nr:hypothetical protein KP509_33G018400 [Ceratopteris richardii]
MDVGSAAALYAGSIVLRKTFEAVAQKSLSSIFNSLHARFRGQDQLQALQRELESRLQVLSLPVDMCVQHVLHGNSALEGALNMVILIVNDIVSFQEELEAQAYNESLVKVSQNEAAKRLEGFLSRLDSILPYLGLAVNAVSLLQTADLELSPSRLMKASHMIRCVDESGVVFHMTAKLYKFETRLTLPRWQEKMLFCHASLRKITKILPDRPDEFELIIIDKKSSEDDAVPLHFPVDRVTAIGSSTLHVLGLGEYNLEGVLLLDLMDASKRLVHYALQCIEDDDESDPESEGEEQGDRTEDSENGFPSIGSTSRISKLGLLEYALRLCMLQNREDKNHWDISDERIRMFFSDPRHVCLPAINAQKNSGGRGVDAIRVTPTQRKKSTNELMQTPPGSAQRHSKHLSITELFYDLRVESPSKAEREESRS